MSSFRIFWHWVLSKRRSVLAGVVYMVCMGGWDEVISAGITYGVGESILLESQAVFPGIVSDGNQLVVSFARSRDLFLRQYDMEFDPIGVAVQVTDRADITDHKHLFFEGEHYLLYSTIGDEDLYLNKFDLEFNQLGTTVTVIEDGATTPTNDMLLATDENLLVVGVFRPSDRNNNETSGHLIKQFTTDLTPYGEEIVVNPFDHVNTASLGIINGMMGIVAPSRGLGELQVQTQKDISLIRLDADWRPVDAEPIILVNGREYSHQIGGDGLWMSTGIAYDEEVGKLFIGYTFNIRTDRNIDAGRIEFSAIDVENYEVQHTEILVDSTTATRAHFLLERGVLYVVYDDAETGSPDVHGMKINILMVVPGDVNKDGVVDVVDLGVVGANFGTVDMDWVHGDFNGDGVVDISDLGILGHNWSRYGQLSPIQESLSVDPGTVVPEPFTLAVCVCGLLGFRRS